MSKDSLVENPVCRDPHARWCRFGLGNDRSDHCPDGRWSEDMPRARWLLAALMLMPIAWAVCCSDRPIVMTQHDGLPLPVRKSAKRGDRRFLVQVPGARTRSTWRTWRRLRRVAASGGPAPADRP